jgi:Zn-dependent protease
MSWDSRDVFETNEPLRTLRSQPEPPAKRAPRLWLHVLLFGLTFLSATWAQSMDVLHAPTLTAALLGPLLHPHRLAVGLIFALTLMTILLAHEMGHYLVARRYGVDQSLPYFVPAPTIFGTLGAVILMRSQPANRRVLLRVAIAGPLAGLALALPAAAWGLAHSPAVDPARLGPNDLWFGSSLLFSALERLFAPGPYYQCHPVALAAWVGLFVTALNLMPAGQLDGGHIGYALFGRRATRLSRLVVVLLLGIGVWRGAADQGVVWLVWAVLLTLLGLSHPPVRDEGVPLARRERWAGYFGLVLFVLTFIPTPVESVATHEERAPPVLEQLETHGTPRTADGLPAEEFKL